VQLAPPTLRTLEDLAAFKTVDRILAWARTSRHLTLAPRLHVDDDRRMLVLPGDTLYPVDDEHRIVGATRFVERDGRWQSETSSA
jgi:hypothetical protein